MPTSNLKEKALQLVDKLPDDATWDDLMYEIYVRQAIEAGLPDSRATDVNEVRAEYGLPT